MKNQKASNIPPLIENGNVINDPKSKSEYLNNLFVSKATVPGSDDPVPLLEPLDSIHSSMTSINTSPIEVSKILMQLVLKLDTFLIYLKLLMLLLFGKDLV